MVATKHKGAHSELAACVWLLEQGYEVFRNVSQHGTTDMVAIKYDMIWRIDVKTSIKYVKKDGSLKESCPHVPAKGVRILIAMADGSFIWQDQISHPTP
jgi:Holliday junction resolvase-like predicted endonuclease